MAIHPISGKPNPVVLPAKSTQSDKTEKPDKSLQDEGIQTTAKSKVNVDITAVAKEITRAFESSHTPPTINEERVKAVKKALQEGSYPINAESIAEKMIQMEREQFNHR